MYFYICIVFWKQKNKLWHTQFNFGISNTDNSNTTMYVCGSDDFYYISDFKKKTVCRTWKSRITRLSRNKFVMCFVDGTLIRIQCPLHNEMEFVCRKDLYAINVFEGLKICMNQTVEISIRTMERAACIRESPNWLQRGLHRLEIKSRVVYLSEIY